MLALITRSLGTIGTLLGAASILLAVELTSSWATIVLWVLIFVSVVTIVADSYNAWKNRSQKYTPNSDGIINYMYRWLNSGGRAAIFTRDMSWATPKSEVRKLLIEKAKRKELLIFVSQVSEFVAKLQEYGAEVYRYPADYTPQSRFTIIDFEKHGARIAIGVVEGKWHIIRESSLKDLPLSPVLEDFVTLARRTGQRVQK